MSRVYIQPIELQ